jgi:hypothetical protein
MINTSRMGFYSLDKNYRSDRIIFSRANKANKRYSQTSTLILLDRYVLKKE